LAGGFLSNLTSTTHEHNSHERKKGLLLNTVAGLPPPSPSSRYDARSAELEVEEDVADAPPVVEADLAA
ncbi:MAG: hypothetical protein LBR95_10160, partial [Azoarcus sp.]|nr:hypothetical protein [Azoarcus sp.]